MVEPEINLAYYEFMGLNYPIELLKKLKMVACEEPENIKENENVLLEHFEGKINNLVALNAKKIDEIGYITLED
jgi:hypothetical protein